MAQQIITTGFDPTSSTQMSGGELAQMVNGATFVTGIGGIIVTTDNNGVPIVPNATTDTTLQNYIWVRVGTPSVSGNFASAYVWNPNQINADNTLLYWNPITAASIAAGSIQGYQIAPNTIPASCLQGGITLSQVTFGSLLTNSLQSTSPFNNGTVQGTQAAGLNLVANAISNINMFLPGVISSNAPFSGQCVSPNNIDTTGAGASTDAVLMATSGSTGVPAWVAKAILNLANPPTDGTEDGYLVAVNSGSAGTFKYLSPTGVTSGKLLQTIVAKSAAASYQSGAGNANVISLTGAPALTVTSGAIVASSSHTGFVLDGTTSGSAKIPLAIQMTLSSASSYIKVRLTVHFITGSVTNVTCALYNIPTANVTSITGGVVTYTGTIGSNINPIGDSGAGYFVGCLEEPSGGMVNCAIFEWIGKASGWTSGTVLNLVPVIGVSSVGGAIGINSTSVSAATAPYTAGYLTSVLEVSEVLY